MQFTMHNAAGMIYFFNVYKFKVWIWNVQKRKVKLFVCVCVCGEGGYKEEVLLSFFRPRFLAGATRQGWHILDGRPWL